MYGLKVLHSGEGIVEVMEPRLRLLVLGGAAKALGVILEPLPVDQQQVAV